MKHNNFQSWGTGTGTQETQNPETVRTETETPEGIINPLGIDPEETPETETPETVPQVNPIETPETEETGTQDRTETAKTWDMFPGLTPEQIETVRGVKKTWDGKFDPETVPEFRDRYTVTIRDFNFFELGFLESSELIRTAKDSSYEAGYESGYSDGQSDLETSELDKVYERTDEIMYDGYTVCYEGDFSEFVGETQELIDEILSRVNEFDCFDKIRTLAENLNSKHGEKLTEVSGRTASGLHQHMRCPNYQDWKENCK